jgi:repressor LexA
MPNHSPAALSAAQRRIIEAVAGAEAKGLPPLVPDLVRQLGLAGESSVTPTLKILQRAGFIEIHGGGRQRAYRFLRLSKKGRQALGVGGLPVLGRIAAGPLREALEQPDDFFDADALLPHRKGDFLLRVAGDSMIGDGILDGDLVLLRPGAEVQAGEIAAAYVGDSFEATLKHVHFERNGVRLRASNPAYDDIVVPRRDWRGVAGVYRGLIRHAEH